MTEPMIKIGHLYGCPKGEGIEVPIAFFEAHRQQAYRNHWQSLERLAERGGLGWGEAIAILNDNDARYSDIPKNREWLRNRFEQWKLAASVDTLPKGRDAKQGLAGTEGSAVAATSGETPTPGPAIDQDGGVSKSAALERFEGFALTMFRAFLVGLESNKAHKWDRESSDVAERNLKAALLDYRQSLAPTQPWSFPMTESRQSAGASANADQALVSDGAQVVSTLTGFDPSRKDDTWNIQRDLERRTAAMRNGVDAAKALHWLQCYGLNPFCGSSYGENFGGHDEAKPYIAAALSSLSKQLSQLAVNLAKADVEAAYASAIEARRAETQGGSVHESAGPKDDAPVQP